MSTVQEYILASVRVDPESDCWLWLGALDRKGYGHSSLMLPTRIAHRVSYEAFVGTIPDGLQLDHLCRVRRCVNPAHLDPVTLRENLRRGAESRTACRKGHPYAVFGVYQRPEGGRACVQCRREAVQRYRARRAS